MSEGRSYVWVYIAGIILMLAVLIIARPYSRFLLTICPPSNLYTPLYNQSITLGQRGNATSFALNHQYVGTYFIDIHLGNVPPYDESIKSDAEILLTIRDNNKTVYERKFSRWANRFGGPETKESGVTLGSYRVPDNISLGHKTEATVSIQTPDPLFEKKYGSARLIIKRITDQ
jgi:hypothetical protein